MLSYLFVEEGKLFSMKSSFAEFNLVFFTVERLACFEMQPRQRSFGWIFRYIWHSMAEKLKFSGGNLCIYKCLIDAREKIQNSPRLEMDFVLNFAMCSADFTCVNGSTLQLVLCELIWRINFVEFEWKWLPRDLHTVVLRPEFCISRLKIHR